MRHAIDILFIPHFQNKDPAGLPSVKKNVNNYAKWDDIYKGNLQTYKLQLIQQIYFTCSNKEII